jgi:hypothetical protein
MADLAERVDDLICSFDSSADATMDTLSMLIFGWMLLGLVILCVGRFVYNRLHQRRRAQPPTSAGQQHRHHAAAAATAAAATATSSAAKEVGHSAAAGLHAIGESVVLLGAGASASGVAAAVARSRSANASRSAGSGYTTSGRPLQARVDSSRVTTTLPFTEPSEGPRAPPSRRRSSESARRLPSRGLCQAR